MEGQRKCHHCYHSAVLQIQDKARKEKNKPQDVLALCRKHTKTNRLPAALHCTVTLLNVTYMLQIYAYKANSTLWDIV